MNSDMRVENGNRHGDFEEDGDEPGKFSDKGWIDRDESKE